MTIGLKRGLVKLSPYSESWPLAYEQEREILMSLAGECIAQIEHIGSTSVPGLMAKPVIDMGIEVDSMQALENMVQRLPKDTYQYFGLRDIPDDYFFAKGPEALRTHYIHVSLKSSGRLANYVKFRNALRQSSELAG